MAEYFSYLPNIRISVPDKGTSLKQFVVTKNLFRRVKAQAQSLRNMTYFEKYTIPGDDKPYNVSYNVYGTPKHEWIILLINDIINIYTEWPLSRVEFERMLKDKYSTKIYDIHHYETNEILDSRGNILFSKGITVEPNFTKMINGAIISSNELVNGVTNYEYEERINESKREIYLPYPDAITTIKSELVRLLQYDPSRDLLADQSDLKNSGDEDFYDFKYFTKGISL
jgi:hypothetical protein